jgi:hypothetical protein
MLIDSAKKNHTETVNFMKNHTETYIVQVLIEIFQNKKETKKRRDEALGLIHYFCDPTVIVTTAVLNNHGSVSQIFISECSKEICC